MTYSIDPKNEFGDFIRRFVWDNMDVMVFLPNTKQEEEFMNGDGVADIEDQLAQLEFIRDRTPEKVISFLSSIREQTETTLSEHEGDYCPLCNFRLATDLHEIIPRSKVRGSYGATVSLFSSTLFCVKVCRECHPKGNDEANKKLLEMKIKRYSIDLIMAELDNINEWLTKPLRLQEFGLDPHEFGWKDE